jgi:hypothetical protein
VDEGEAKRQAIKKKIGAQVDRGEMEEALYV